MFVLNHLILRKYVKYYGISKFSGELFRFSAALIYPSNVCFLKQKMVKPQAFLKVSKYFLQNKSLVLLF